MCLSDSKNDYVSSVVGRLGKWADCDWLVRLWNTGLPAASGNTSRSIGTEWLIDVGANIGGCTIEMLLQSNSRILAFEPSAMNRFFLTRTLAAAAARHPQLRGRVALLPFAAGDVRATGHLVVPKGNLGGTHLASHGKGEDTPHWMGGKVDVHPLDAMVRHGASVGPAAPRVRLIKVDVEGNECAVLRGAPRVLQHAVGAMVEVNRATQVPLKCVESQLHRLVAHAGLVPHVRNTMSELSLFARRVSVLPLVGNLTRGCLLLTGIILTLPSNQGVHGACTVLPTAAMPSGQSPPLSSASAVSPPGSPAMPPAARKASGGDDASRDPTKDPRAARESKEPSESKEGAAVVFLNLRKRLATEERPAGLPCAVVSFVVGDDHWVVDLREGLTPEQAVRRGEPEGSPDVRVTISLADFQALLEGRLSAFKVQHPRHCHARPPPCLPARTHTRHRAPTRRPHARLLPFRRPTPTTAFPYPYRLPQGGDIEAAGNRGRHAPRPLTRLAVGATSGLCARPGGWDGARACLGHQGGRQPRCVRAARRGGRS
jgi:FkbM family methyltransferase